MQGVPIGKKTDLPIPLDNVPGLEPILVATPKKPMPIISAGSWRVPLLSALMIPLPPSVTKRIFFDNTHPRLSMFEKSSWQISLFSGHPPCQPTSPPNILKQLTCLFPPKGVFSHLSGTFLFAQPWIVPRLSHSFKFQLNSV